MRKDTAFILSAIILSIFCYVTDAFGRGVVLIAGVAGLIGIIALLTTASPLTDLSENEERVLRQEKKLLPFVLAIILFNIIAFYAVYDFMGGSPDDNKLILAVTTALGLASLVGFVLGLIISAFPYKGMDFINKFNRGALLGLLIVHSLQAIIYGITWLTMTPLLARV
ncbi:hypothetical protein [Hymenobacter sp. BT730]|uniref:hypothetical protein n=1 Tax=Hymenobacter sp. BT730 TaxID=3063332 RepID=UPI0026E03056|nr:hypothetical protein [Hymenobacter sp. BT730]